MIKQREIPKQVVLPKNLMPEVVGLINEVLFDVSDELKEPCEAVLIFGSSITENHRKIDTLMGLVYQKIGFSRVYITSGITKEGVAPESEQVHALLAPKYPAVEFLLDRVSSNTKDNVANAVELGLGNHRNILFVAKAPHCGRCKLTLSKFVPRATIRHCGYVPTVLESGPEIRQDWHTFPQLTAFMWGELLRIETYGKRVDIAYPKEIESKILRIHELTAI